MEVPCVNLKERFGRRFKIVYEESYQAAYGPRATRDDPWYQIIPGARGHVYPFNERYLAASTNTSGSIAKGLRALPFVRLWNDGADGATVLFPPERLDEIAGLLKLRRRRRVTDQDRARLAELGRLRRFQSRHHGLQSDSEAGESTIAAPAAPETCPGKGRFSARRTPWK